MHLRDKRHVICATEVYRSFKFDDVTVSRSQWPHGLRRRSSGARLLRSWVRIPPGSWIFVCCECRVFSGRGLCNELITRPEESYRLWCVVVCDLKTSRMRRPWPALGRSATKKMVVHIVTTGHKWLSTDEAKWNCGSIWARTIGNSKTLIYIFWKDNFENHLPTLNSTLNLPALYFHNSMWYYGTFAWKIWGS